MVLAQEFSDQYPENTAYEAVRISRLSVGLNDQTELPTQIEMTQCMIWMKYNMGSVNQILSEESKLLAIEFANTHGEQAAKQAVDILHAFTERSHNQGSTLDFYGATAWREHHLDEYIQQASTMQAQFASLFAEVTAAMTSRASCVSNFWSTTSNSPMTQRYVVLKF